MSTSRESTCNEGHQKEINIGPVCLQGRAFQVPSLGTAPSGAKGRNPNSLLEEAGKTLETQVPFGDLCGTWDELGACRNQNSLGQINLWIALCNTRTEKLEPKTEGDLPKSMKQVLAWSVPHVNSKILHSHHENNII